MFGGGRGLCSSFLGVFRQFLLQLVPSRGNLSSAPLSPIPPPPQPPPPPNEIIALQREGARTKAPVLPWPVDQGQACDFPPGTEKEDHTGVEECHPMTSHHRMGPSQINVPGGNAGCSDPSLLVGREGLPPTP